MYLITHAFFIIIINKTLFNPGKLSAEHYKLKTDIRLFPATALHDCRVGIRYDGYLLHIWLRLNNRTDIF